MLSKEQFRATPFTSLKQKSNEIPAWQQIADEMAAEKQAECEASESKSEEAEPVVAGNESDEPNKVDSGGVDLESNVTPAANAETVVEQTFTAPAVDMNIIDPTATTSPSSLSVGDTDIIDPPVTTPFAS